MAFVLLLLENHHLRQLTKGVLTLPLLSKLIKGVPLYNFLRVNLYVHTGKMRTYEAEAGAKLSRTTSSPRAPLGIVTVRPLSTCDLPHVA